MTVLHPLRSTEDARLIASDIRRLAVGEVRLDEDLRAYSRWRSGGRADLVVTPRDKESVSRLLSYFYVQGIPWAVVGEGSNLIFDDAGVRIPLVQIGPKLDRVVVDNCLVRAEAGAWAPAVALKAMRAGLGGIEHTIGIPGTFGGLVLMNGGSLRQGIGEHIVEVEIAERDGTLRSISAHACGFAYRRSTLQDRGAIVLGATLALTPRDSGIMRRRMIEIMGSRRRRFPRDLPNCGSVFVSDPALYATFGPPGSVIELTGLKGARQGDAMVSPRHANFIVNLGQASSADILALIQRVRDTVASRTGHLMRCEVRFMNSNGEAREVHDWLDDLAWHGTRAEPPAEALHG
jgi:UDP-N-acetylmuramate dehydrogenase